MELWRLSLCVQLDCAQRTQQLAVQVLITEMPLFTAVGMPVS